MAGQHHQLNGHELEQTLGDIGGQRSLVCCSPWGVKEPNTAQQLNNNEQPLRINQKKMHCRYFKLEGKQVLTRPLEELQKRKLELPPALRFTTNFRGLESWSHRTTTADNHGQQKDRLSKDNIWGHPKASHLPKPTHVPITTREAITLIWPLCAGESYLNACGH